MAPNTAENLTNADLGSGGYQSFPDTNPQSSNTGIHARQTFKSDVDEKAQKTGMIADDMKLVLTAKEQYMDLRVETVMAAAKRHRRLAFVAFFVAIAEIILAQVVTPKISGVSYSEIDASVRARIYFFSFGAPVLDILGGVYIFRYARNLLQRANEATAKGRVQFKVGDVALHGPGRDHDETPSWLPDFGEVPDGFLSLHIPDHPLDLNFNGAVLCFFGTVFFLASNCVFVIMTQRWVTLVVALPVIVTMSWFSLSEELHHGRLCVWGQAVAISGSG